MGRGTLSERAAGVTAPSGAMLRAPALGWALLHVPLFLALYLPSLMRALGSVPGRFRFPLGLVYVVEAAFLAALTYLVTLPFSLKGRVYRFLAPAVMGLVTVGLVIDSSLFRAVGFHVNGLFFRVLAQPAALEEVGIPSWEVAVFLTLALAWLVAETWVGSRVLLRFAARRGTTLVVALLVVLELGGRVVVATLSFTGGPSVYAAGQVLPLQAPLRMNRVLGRLTGRGRTMVDRFDLAAERSEGRFPEGLAPADVHLARKPDIVLVLVESLRSDFFDPKTMPRLVRRAAGGAVFERHYASASSTHYSLFSLFFGLQSQKLEAVVGAGRSPLFFAALRANGYRSRLITASSVDWMGLKRTVFRDVEGDLETDLPGMGAARDSAMLASAERFVSGAGAEPVFLLLFFTGTHFNYTFPERSARFRPYWDGVGSIEAARVAPSMLRDRARNAAYEVDRKLDEFLDWFVALRGRETLVVITGDHGEAFREHGRVGHASDVSEEQIHVPMVVLDGARFHGERYGMVTSHVDVVPTLFSLLGDTQPPSSYADGVSMLEAPRDRFVLSSVGWEPRFAAIGHDLKATFFAFDAGFGGVAVTDPWDRPLPNANARFAAQAANILRAFVRPAAGG